MWSMDGRKIAFLRQPGAGGAPRSPLVEPPSVWAVMVAGVDAASMPAPDGGSAIAAVTSGEAPGDVIVRHPGGIAFRWAADDTPRVPVVSRRLAARVCAAAAQARAARRDC